MGGVFHGQGRNANANANNRGSNNLDRHSCEAIHESPNGQDARAIGMHGARILLIPYDVSRIETDKREKSFAWYQNEQVRARRGFGAARPLDCRLGAECCKDT